MPIRLMSALVLCTLAAAPAVAQRGPAAAALHLDARIIGLACAPSVVYELPMASLQITGGQDSFVRRSYVPGDLITINAGTNNGIEVGQEFYTRRILHESRRTVNRTSPGVVRTTGWIKVYAVDKEMSLATITHACETIDVGDYLDPFALPVVPAPDAEILPAERDNYGRILVGEDRRSSFGKGDYMVIDRGSDHGIAPGARLVIYRDKLQAKNFLYDLGEAVAVDVKTDTATVLVTVARDGLKSGDYVALRKPAPEAP